MPAGTRVCPGPWVRFDHVGCSYGGAPVIEDVTFTIDAHEFVGLVGPSGGGKTTVLRAMLGILEPGFGRVVRSGDLRLGYVPQVGGRLELPCHGPRCRPDDDRSPAMAPAQRA